MAALEHDNMPAESMIDLLERRCAESGDWPALTYRDDEGRETTWSYRDLRRRVGVIAARLRELASPGDRVLLAYPAGMEFVAAWFGCLYAGALPVPTSQPKPRRPMPRLLSLAEDCEAELLLTDAASLERLDPSAYGSGRLEAAHWAATDLWHEETDVEPPSVAAADRAFLQYTSGSTSEPRGVILTHGNLLHNLEAIKQGFGLPRYVAGQADRPGFESRTGVFWLPGYHDMGLIGGILTPLYVGGHAVLMNPSSFLQRPLDWLEAISRHRAVVSGGPNFAFELCARKIDAEQRAELDLSCWKVAFCGAEPIRPASLAEFAETFADCGFSHQAYYPCYGLAEGTLLAAGPSGPASPRVFRASRDALAKQRVRLSHNGDPAVALTGCGRAIHDQQLLLVNPDSGRVCPPGEIGEVWLSGPSIAAGYWNRPEETRETFEATPRGMDETRRYLRTGDLGFLLDEDLFIAGRIKEMMIIRGRNFFPHDLENAVAEVHEALFPSAAAAFAVVEDGQEAAVLVHEVQRNWRDFDLDQAMRAIRGRISMEFDLELAEIVLIRPAGLPRTTSGKVQRSLCRDQLAAEALKIVARWRRSDEPERKRIEFAPLTLPTSPGSAAERDAVAAQIEAELVRWLVEIVGVPVDEVDRERPFAEYGVDSLAGVELARDLESWLGVRLTPVAVWNHPTPAAMSVYLTQQALGEVAGEEDPHAGFDSAGGDDFGHLLDEIEALSDDEADRAARST